MGSLDDPIWRVVVDPTVQRRSHERLPRRGSRKSAGRAIALAVGAAATVAVVVTLVVHLGAGARPGGDPGGVVLRSLDRIKTAVPSAASTVRVHADGVQWVGVCGDPGSKAGWLPAFVSITFTDGDPRATVVSQIDSVLRGLGWKRNDTTTPQKGLIAHWARRERTGSAGSAFAYPIPAGSHNWFMTATWRPPGPAARTCA